MANYKYSLQNSQQISCIILFRIVVVETGLRCGLGKKFLGHEKIIKSKTTGLDRKKYPACDHHMPRFKFNILGMQSKF